MTKKSELQNKDLDVRKISWTVKPGDFDLWKTVSLQEMSGVTSWQNYFVLSKMQGKLFTVTWIPLFNSSSWLLHCWTQHAANVWPPCHGIQTFCKLYVLTGRQNLQHFVLNNTATCCLISAMLCLMGQTMQDRFRLSAWWEMRGNPCLANRSIILSATVHN